MHTPTLLLRFEYIFNPHIHACRAVDQFGNTTAENWYYGPSDLDDRQMATSSLDALNSRYLGLLHCHWILSHKNKVINTDRTINYHPYSVKFNGKKEIKATRIMLHVLEGKDNEK